MPGDGEVIPANAPVLVWLPPKDYTQPQPGNTLPALRFLRLDGGAAEPVAFTLEAQSSGLQWIRPAAPLAAGARYRMEVDGECATPAVELQTAEASDFPDSLGTLVVSAPAAGEIRVGTVSGSCDTPLPAVIVDVDVALSEQAAPWASLLSYRTLVDGSEWSPTWSLGEPPYDFSAAQTKVFAECPDRPLASGQPIDMYAMHEGLSEGKHALRVEAELAGVDGTLQTDATDVQLSCATGGGQGGAHLTPGSMAGSGGSGCSALGAASSPASVWPWLIPAFALSGRAARRRYRARARA